MTCLFGRSLENTSHRWGMYQTHTCVAAEAGIPLFPSFRLDLSLMVKKEGVATPCVAAAFDMSVGGAPGLVPHQSWWGTRVYLEGIFRFVNW